eukprot:scaffold24816_cov130-Isochrysis_galbana.AAC.1
MAYSAWNSRLIVTMLPSFWTYHSPDVGTITRRSWTRRLYCECVSRVVRSDGRYSFRLSVLLWPEPETSASAWNSWPSVNGSASPSPSDPSTVPSRFRGSYDTHTRSVSTRAGLPLAVGAAAGGSKRITRKGSQGSTASSLSRCVTRAAPSLSPMERRICERHSSRSSGSKMSRYWSIELKWTGTLRSEYMGSPESI